jgi:ADP-ribosylglycohydrolase
MATDVTKTVLYEKALGCLVAGVIGDAMGTPTEGMTYQDIEKKFGWVSDFTGDGTDDTVMRDILAGVLVKTGGYARIDDWAQGWIDSRPRFLGEKRARFFVSVLHTVEKLTRGGWLPRQAALGNMPSSSSAMCIAPVGIVNACNPGQAALQAYNLAGLIHTHDVSFCQDGAAAIAVAVAEACRTAASVDSILSAAVTHLDPVSGRQMRGRIKEMVDLAASSGSYQEFRRTVYDRRERFFQAITCDSRETIPLTFGIFRLAGGDVSQCVQYAANFGRDADTIAAMAGGIAGALRGYGAIPAAWREKSREVMGTEQERIAGDLVRVAAAKLETEQRMQGDLERLVG